MPSRKVTPQHLQRFLVSLQQIKVSGIFTFIYLLIYLCYHHLFITIQVQRIYDGFQFCIFMVFLSVETLGLLLLVCLFVFVLF